MRIYRGLLVFVVVLFASNLNAKIQSSYHIFNSDMKVEECLDISKKARASLFKERFGEIVADNLYDYLRDDLHISVLCLAKKKTIVIIIAAENREIYDFMEVFSRHFKSHGATTMVE